MTPISVLFLTRYDRSGASSRYRIYQYLPSLEQAGIHCEVSPLFDENYVQHYYSSRHGTPFDFGRALARRLWALMGIRRYDLIIVEKEIFPYFSAMPEKILKWLVVPYIVDYDDAIFHQYDRHTNWLFRNLLKNKIQKVMSNAAAVIAGNAYIAEYARKVNKRVIVIPTVINTDKYRASEMKRENEFVVGWIGSPSTSRYLKLVEPALKNFCKKENARLHLVGSGTVQLDGIPFQIQEWSEEKEVDMINFFDVGIMPLEDTPWERGKCGFKLIQYMGCGKPVIASPVGMNAEIVQEGVNGFFAKSQEEWGEKMQVLRNDRELRHRLGREGRKRIEKKYALHVWAPVYLKVIREMADRKK